MNVTLTELRDELFAVKGASMVTMVARTLPDLIGGKKRSPMAGLEKVSRVNGVINWHYANAVNKQREREGHGEHFTAQPRSWGVRLFELLEAERLAAIAERRDPKPRLLPLVAKKWEGRLITLDELRTLPPEELYLEYKPEKTLEYHYYREGVEVSHDEAHKFTKPSEQPSTQETEKEIRLRDYKLTSIEQLTMNGITYVVTK